jgi:microcystin-dependent protein
MTLHGALVAVVVAGMLVISGVSPAAASCGFEPFIGQVCTFAFDFCPKGFAPADGRLMAINTQTPLFAVLGTIYGGDGVTTFALPDLRGRTAVGASLDGSAPPLGQTAGDATTVNLRLDNASGGVQVPAAQSPFVGLTRCIAIDGLFPPRPQDEGRK